MSRIKKPVIYFNNLAKAPFTDQYVKRRARLIANEILPSKNNLSEISIAIVDEKTIRQLNKKYRKKNRATSVLTFGNITDDLAEIVLCWNKIHQEAKINGLKQKDYFFYALKHGFKNLLKK